jgi:hypothetical protein
VKQTGCSRVNYSAKMMGYWKQTQTPMGWKMDYSMG